MTKEVIFTSCGKMGDFLYTLPVGSWLARERNCKVHWVLPKCFGPFQYIEKLLMLQPMTSRVSLVNYTVQNYDCGGQPYKFNPADFGIEGEYYNLGFRGYPSAYLSRFYAEEHGLDYDRGFKLRLYRYGADGIDFYVNTGFPAEPTEILRSSERSMSQLVPQAEPLPTHEDLLLLARRIAMAKEFHSWFCGMAVLCYFAGIPAHVYRVPGHAPLDLYFEGDHELQFHEVTL